MAQVREWDGRDVPGLMLLEQLDRDLFRNRLNQTNMNHALFGGQVLAQALTAAGLTVSDDGAPRRAHSLHGYFLRPGLATMPAIYQVERTRDGGHFSTRRVVAFQEGKPIFHMECGFHAAEEGFEHQLPLPGGVPRPEELGSLRDLVDSMDDRSHPWLRRWADLPDWPVDVRPVDPGRFFHSDDQVPRRMVWMRVPGAAGAPEATQAAILAWMSDYWLAGTAALPHAAMSPDPALFVASIDHAMWFHRPADAADWLLLDLDSPSAQSGCGLSRALVYAGDGRLVASAAQEALLRRRKR